jgi:hypothetical protein
MILNNPRYQCDAAIRFRMHSDAKTDEDLIDFADALSLDKKGTELDSPDLGDSMGLFIELAYAEYMEGELFTIFTSPNGFSVEVEVDIDLFSWKDRN